MKRIVITQTLLNMFLVAVSSLFALLTVEIALRYLSPDEYYVWRPNLQTTFHPLPEVMPGIEGSSKFHISELGMRAEPVTGYERYKILTVGGSTTECLYLDQSEAWPHLVQEKLNKQLKGPTVWVGNVGVSGLNTRHHILQVEKLLDTHSDINLVVLMIGVNDLHMRLSKDSEYVPLMEEDGEYQKKLLSQAFAIHPEGNEKDPFYKNTEIWRLLRKFKNALSRQDKKQLTQDETGTIYIKWRRHRQNAPRIRETLPDLSQAINEYVTNIEALVDMVEQKRIRVMFMTQPSMWRADLPEELVDLLWLGGVGNFQEESGKEYYSVSALADAMKTYNKALLKVCTERALECIDLASLVPKDQSAFYDDVHFNEAGAEMVASVLVQYLIDTGLLESKEVDPKGRPGWQQE